MAAGQVFAIIFTRYEKVEVKMTAKIETIIIGAGQAGLAASYQLTQAGLEHLVLERNSQVGEVWQRERWDSFTFVTPNWSIRLPGAEYDGPYPDGYMPRADIVAYLQRYAAKYQLPIRLNTCVTGVDQDPAGERFIVQTEQDSIEAKNVIIAAGHFQTPKIPDFAQSLPGDILQMHSSRYRNPQSLPSGAVLVVGSAQSGCQITEELYMSGRRVYLSVGRAGRALRRYRGKDGWEWLNMIGFLDRPVESLPNPQARFEAVPHLSGTRGGHSLNLHQFARDGVHLLGHLQGVKDGKALLSPDLMENLARADRFEAEQVKMIDALIARMGLDAPQESLTALRDGFDTPVLSELDLHAEGIRTVIFATGYKFDFHWVKPAALDDHGFPITNRGVSPCTGLYFLGLPWQPNLKSALMLGIGDAAGYIANDIQKRERN